MPLVSLSQPSPNAWLDAVLAAFNEFLIDHAANERKASAMAMSLVAHYPDRQELVTRMIDLALEEMNHFRQVVRLLQERGLVMAADVRDPYVNQLRSHVRKGRDEYFLDRLLSGAVIEARGEERFLLIAESLQDARLTTFYSTLARSEQGHHRLFLELAHLYFPTSTVEARLADWIAIEASVMQSLPIRSRLH